MHTSRTFSPGTCSSGACSRGIDRRALLVGAGAAVAGSAGMGLVLRAGRPRASVFLARVRGYDGPLERVIRDGLASVGITRDRVRGRRVLLKPNLVEPARSAPHLTTHPAMIVAAAEVFRRWEAQVVVGEAPGHLRDTEFVLAESGVGEALAAAGVPFVDLNYEESRPLPNAGGASSLTNIYFPRQVLEADLVVSLPKLKTHHWAGMTAAMKNLYGVLPGLRYGWPKNVLHHAGIHQTVHDINATLPGTIAIVDAIQCMEGDGPIMGTPKPLGMVAVGANLTAVDATCARVMGLAPARLGYLALAADRLGPVALARISQRGESVQDMASPFCLIDDPYLQSLRAGAV